MGYWDEVKATWNAMVEGNFPMAGPPPPGPRSTGDGTWNDPGEPTPLGLSPNELRKLLEAFMRERGYLPRTQEEFEHWLES